MRNELAEIETCCKGIIAETRELLKWEWDGYIGAFLATFTVGQAQPIETLCNKYFMSRWDHESLVKAPPSVLAIAENLGGLRAAQRLLMTRPDQFVMAFGAWWPWGDGQTISLRIGLVTDDVPEHAKTELFKEFSEWFTNPDAAETLEVSD
ncbi:MAG: hypothetical protein QGH60_02475 [Phycisphaerae bacterium]|jgi:hypothetical protein|nr:hypothetical protein [Phycisphaerae bacterium]